MKMLIQFWNWLLGKTTLDEKFIKIVKKTKKRGRPKKETLTDFEKEWKKDLDKDYKKKYDKYTVDRSKK
jgi:hypothetical protein|tara:strand:+ start:75 stop:281 length:207 start_codon:yes stop_codon:yes gene_type:complete